MLNKNWKSILKINNKNVVLIQDNNQMLITKEFIDSEEIIKISSENYYVFPSLVEILNKDKSSLIKKYSNEFKLFLTKKEKETIITHEIIFKSLVKEERQGDFLNLIIKNNKKIIIITEKNQDEINVDKYDIFLAKLTYEDWQENLHITEKFKEINLIFKKILNPFKDPKMAYLKYIEN